MTTRAVLLRPTSLRPLIRSTNRIVWDSLGDDGAPLVRMDDGRLYTFDAAMDAWCVLRPAKHAAHRLLLNEPSSSVARLANVTRAAFTGDSVIADALRQSEAAATISS